MRGDIFSEAPSWRTVFEMLAVHRTKKSRELLGMGMAMLCGCLWRRDFAM